MPNSQEAVMPSYRIIRTVTVAFALALAVSATAAAQPADRFAPPTNPDAVISAPAGDTKGDLVAPSGSASAGDTKGDLTRTPVISAPAKPSVSVDGGDGIPTALFLAALGMVLVAGAASFALGRHSGRRRTTPVMGA